MSSLITLASARNDEGNALAKLILHAQDLANLLTLISEDESVLADYRADAVSRLRSYQRAVDRYNNASIERAVTRRVKCDTRTTKNTTKNTARKAG